MRLVANIKFDNNTEKNSIEKTVVTLLQQTVKLTRIYLNKSPNCTLEITKFNNDNVITNIVPNEYINFEELYFSNEEVEPDTMVFIFKANVLYPENTVEKMLIKWLENDTTQKMMLGSSGLKFGTFPFYKSMVYNSPRLNKKFYIFDFNKAEPVDVLFFSPGVLTLKEWLPKPPLEITNGLALEIFVANHFEKKLVFKLPPVENEPVISKTDLWTIYKKKYYTINPMVKIKYMYTFSYPFVLSFSVFIFLIVIFSILFYKF